MSWVLSDDGSAPQLARTALCAARSKLPTVHTVNGAFTGLAWLPVVIRASFSAVGGFSNNFHSHRSCASTTLSAAFAIVQLVDTVRFVVIAFIATTFDSVTWRTRPKAQITDSDDVHCDLLSSTATLGTAFAVSDGVLARSHTSRVLAVAVLISWASLASCAWWSDDDHFVHVLVAVAVILASLPATVGVLAVLRACLGVARDAIAIRAGFTIVRRLGDDHRVACLDTTATRSRTLAVVAPHVSTIHGTVAGGAARWCVRTQRASWFLVGVFGTDDGFLAAGEDEMSSSSKVIVIERADPRFVNVGTQRSEVIGMNIGQGFSGGVACIFVVARLGEVGELFSMGVYHNSLTRSQSEQTHHHDSDQQR